MYTLLQVSLNLFAIVILLAILMDIRNQNELRSGKQRHYVALVYANIAVLALEAAAWIVDRRPGELFRGLNIYINVAYFIADSIPALMWVIFVNYQVYGETLYAKRLNFLLAFPAAMDVVLSILTPFNGWLFRVDSANIYLRGERFYLIATILIAYLTYSIATILLNRNRLTRRAFYTLLLFHLPAILGGILQGFFYGVPSLWAGTAIMLLFTYLNIQSTRLGADYLTGISNRRDIDSYLGGLIKESSKDSSFSGIFMDIDGFKEINDRFGHIMGDEALRVTADLLKRSIRKDDFIARFGGDEFIILARKINDPEVLEATVRRINESFAEFNVVAKLPFRLTLSMGYAVYDKASGEDAEQFIKRLDEMMYANKRASEEAAGI